MNLRHLCLAVIGSAFCLSSCTMMTAVNPKPKFHAADPLAVVPTDFLATKYGPLNAWLDQAVRVQILDVPLLDVFRHPSLSGLQYVVVKAPPENPTVTIDKLALTRRQLLWVISQDYQLHMTPIYGSGGQVTHIEIRSRSVDLPNKN